MPSSRPNVAAKAAEEVAMDLNPASLKRRADGPSHALGMMNVSGPRWSSTNSS
jgi:hypothetical protein